MTFLWSKNRKFRIFITFHHIEVHWWTFLHISVIFLIISFLMRSHCLIVMKTGKHMIIWSIYTLIWPLIIACGRHLEFETLPPFWLMGSTHFLMSRPHRTHFWSNLFYCSFFRKKSYFYWTRSRNEFDKNIHPQCSCESRNNWCVNLIYII